MHNVTLRDHSIRFFSFELDRAPVQPSRGWQKVAISGGWNMLKKIGLSTAAMLAAMALIQAPSALAASRDDFRARNSYSSGYVSGYRDSGYRDDVRYQSNYRSADRDDDDRYVPQTRSSRLRGRFEYH